MMKKLFSLLVLFSGTVFAGIRAQTNNAETTVKVQSHSPAVPVLRGLSQNPVLRLTVTVPENAGAITLDAIDCKLNSEGLKSTALIEVYKTNGTSFSNPALVAKQASLSSRNSLSLKQPFQPGTHYFWISITASTSAALQQSISLTCPAVYINSAKIPVLHDGSSTVKRIGVAVKKAGDDGIHTYRIPGIIKTNKGSLIAVYDNRYKNSTDLPGNIDVGMSRSTDGGNTWEPMKVIMDMGAPHENNGVGDPSVLFDPETNRIWVAALWSKGNRSIAGSMPGLSPDSTGQFVLVYSDDDGLTWSAPESITPQVKNPKWRLFFNGPGNGITMQNGTLVFAAQYWDEHKMPHSTIIYSDDKGKTWKGNIAGPKSNTTEAQVVETTPGTLLLNMRDNRGKFRSMATTQNMGTQWAEHPASYNTLTDPVCMGSIIKAGVKVKGKKREVLFFSNPNDAKSRINMTIKASLDLGNTWLPGNQYLADERPGFGYSCLVQLDDKTIGMLYEGTRDLYFIAIPIKEILK